MKLRELIGDLERLSASNPDADVKFEWHKFNGAGTCSSDAGFVDARFDGQRAVIRLTEPHRIEDVKKWSVDA